MSEKTTEQPVQKTNLYQRLLAITDEIGKIEKTGRNTMQNYAFIEQAQVVASLRPLLVKHGVFILPEITNREMNRFEVKRGNGKDGVDIHVTVKGMYTLVNVDNPEDQLSLEWDAGEAIDSSDKATNKAVTANNKTFLMKLFNISDKDDADNDSPELQTSQPSYTSNKGKKATAKQIDYMRSVAKQKTGLEEATDIDEWLTEILTMKPQEVPIWKVGDAVEFIKDYQMTPPPNISKAEVDEIAELLEGEPMPEDFLKNIPY